MCGILFHHHKEPTPSFPDAAESQTITITEEQIRQIQCSTSSDDHSIFIDSTTTLPSLYKSLIPSILARGPNHAQLYQTSKESYFSSVLSLRSPFTAQPVHDTRYVIQFNGELYGAEIQGNDTAYLLNQLEQSQGNVAEVIGNLDGEFAFVIVDLQLKKCYYGRDSQGKRSLCHWVDNDDDQLYVSSVHPSDVVVREKFENCLSGTIYQYDLAQSVALESTTISNNYSVLNAIDEPMDNKQIHLEQLDRLLRHATEKRIQTIQPYHSTPNHLYSILFSGGLDCTIIAALAAESYSSSSGEKPIIDLLNVGFENPRTGLMPADAPDRLLARSSWSSLVEKYGDLVTFQLIEIDVPYEEYLAAKSKVMELMYPKNTEMDLSIAMAFYFASKGHGRRLSMVEEKGEENYQSPCKVLLSGLGADELYGGYHKFNSRSLEQLVPELTIQINGIYDRNLNRDDKVISSNGVEVRYPYLDHELITYSTAEIEINYKVAKYILREYADSLGLAFVKDEKKRAIQFGAKSARMVKDGTKKGQALVE